MDNYTTSAPPEGMTPASDELVEIMRELLPIYLILFIFGLAFALLNVPLLYTLLLSKKLRNDSKVSPENPVHFSSGSL